MGGDGALLALSVASPQACPGSNLAPDLHNPGHHVLTYTQLTEWTRVLNKLKYAKHLK